jgi:carbon starvation protein
LFFAGNIYPIILGKGSFYIWLAVLFIYAYFASILPVNILLQPRDYLCSFLLLFGVGLGLMCIFISPPLMRIPAYQGWSTSQGYLWPMMFVVVACGAISGFHTLVASGTTSKQLSNERYARRIGYGAMLMEAVVAILTIVAVGSAFSKEQNLSLVLKTLGPIRAFSKGYSHITSFMLKGFGEIIAITILNAFILTTLDTATRICRYLTEELFGFKNRFASSILIVGLSGLLAFTGKWAKIWPVFGASNQLVAALALFVMSCWLLSRNRPMRFTLIPAMFMLFTTFFALILQVIKYFLQRDILLLAITISLLVLTGFMVKEAVFRIKSIKKEKVKKNK